MSRFRVARAVVIACVASVAAASARASYTVVILHPPGYEQTFGTGIAGGQQVGYALGPTSHPLLWTGSAASVVDLRPEWALGGRALATDGVRQAGWTIALPGAPTQEHHATIWSGTAASAVDVHPAGYTASYAHAIRGSQSAGFALDPNHFDLSRAIVWDLTSGQATNLHPATGYTTSWAEGTDGTRQVGIGIRDGSLLNQALVWSGTAASVIELPSPFNGSGAAGVHGDQIVGQAGGYAALWHGPDHTYVNLGRPGVAYATNGHQQVGAFSSHAALWSGSADTFIDLHDLLPAGFLGSVAQSIDAHGVILGTASTPTGAVAVLWVSVVPEPGASLLWVGLAAMLGTWR